MVVGSETTGAFCQSEILSGQNVIELEEGNHVVKNVFCGLRVGVALSKKLEELWFPGWFACGLG